MQSVRLIIDCDDAYSTYGLFLKNGGLAALIGWPQFKKVKTTDWYEENGLEADLISPVLDGRTVQLPFHLAHHNTPSMARILLDVLTTVPTGGSVYHTFAIPRLGVSYSLRYVNNGSYNMNEAFDTFTLSMAEDSVTKPALGNNVTLDFGNNVTETFTIAIPTSESVPLSGYAIDGYDMALFGMYVVKGTLDSFQKYPRVKEALKRNISIQNGVLYDGSGSIQVMPQDVTMKLHIQSSDVTLFWKMWYALFAVLMSDGERMLYGGGRFFACYYKSVKVDKFVLLSDNSVWCDFSLSLAVLREQPITLLGVPYNGSTVAIIDDNNVVISI